MKLTRVILSIVITVVMLFNLCGCSLTENLQRNVAKNKIEALSDLSLNTNAIINFSFEFFKHSEVKNKNSLVSPLSAIMALGISANGAKGNTLTQLEKAFGMKAQDLNVYLYSLSKAFEKDKAKVNLANSVWFTSDERFTVNKEFLQTSADYYDADIFKTPMNNSTVRDVNNWVKDETDGMIEEIADSDLINGDTVMCLLNALCFEGDWVEEYFSEDVEEGEFTSISGEKQVCDFMHGSEYTYLENENSKGFIKPYKNSDFAFVALLPNKDISLEEYIKILDYKTFNEIMENKIETSVQVSIPKFDSEFDFYANDTLVKMGVTDIFDFELADLSGLGKSAAGNIWVKTVKQKTFISVAEKGTRASAATMVVADDSLFRDDKQVYLNRPFVYMIIDTNTNIPLFIGTLNDMG